MDSKTLYILFINLALFVQCMGQEPPSTGEFAKVEHCTPFDHAKCVYTTAAEVYRDGRSGKVSKHWGRMSYIGRAYTTRFGKVIGILYEGLFIVPHYVGIGIANVSGIIVYALRGEKGKVKKNKQELVEHAG